eukprot:CAMPEP_0174278152 /NCGR_PEP_ID=MMETSP0439-20130205/61319_1 /TAXON_ID=0 /ORGANISM="Stereomyxa ramosa, Strain Chinc5" /LENGTH=77 /DNA_ID=CAMNT_0015370531 /DNA_START=1394 /DNA_END=1624 /DNA_ORIENTATION=-
MILEEIEPPYSNKFVNTLLEIMDKANIKSQKNVQEQKEIIAFISHCTERKEEYSFDDETKELLEQLHDAFGPTTLKI